MNVTSLGFRLRQNCKFLTPSLFVKNFFERELIKPREIVINDES
jgi:hypothetical protein